MKEHIYIISYSQHDSSAFVRRLALDLKSRQYNVWLDVLDIKGGEAWDTAIQQALDGADSMLIILSPGSVASKNVMDEVSYMLNRGKTVIPILTQDCNIPYRLDRIQYVDFRTSYEQGLDLLINTLHAGPATATAEVHASSVARKKMTYSRVYVIIYLILIIGIILLAKMKCSPG